MLWPLILPFKIAFWLLAGLVAIVTILAPSLKWKRGKTFAIALLLAIVAFIPSCTGIMAIVDSQRFGLFQYDSFAQVNDERIERYLPTQARNITLEKYAAGHRARYSISESDLMAYVDGLWDQYGEYSATERDDLDDGAKVSPESFDLYFGDLGWPVLENAIELNSPREGDGGGATYFLDRSGGTVYHFAGYW